MKGRADASCALLERGRQKERIIFTLYILKE